ncbi:glycosyltransferase family protein [Longispora albida]|uniref:glycosyltransferase family protein n=1 Tax=Longispora albida TaxID=203523 RepID=UPI0003AAFC36|nr:glycosyltransferase [Longispora albida]
MLRIALLAGSLGTEASALLRGLRRAEFHLVTFAEPAGRAVLPANVLSVTHLPGRLAPPPTGWRVMDAAAHQLGRGSSGLASGLRMLSGLVASFPVPEAREPSFGPEPLGGLRLTPYGVPGGYRKAVRPLALRLPPVHLVHAIGPDAALAALAHNWRHGTPYILTGDQGPFGALCRARADAVMSLPPVLDPSDYPPRAPGSVLLQISHAGHGPLGAEFFAGGSVVALTCGVSYPLIEAMLSGLPVVAAEAPGVAEILGGGGLVVPAADVTSACRLLLSDPELRAEMGLAGRQRALARHTIAPWLAAHETAYELLSEPAAGRWGTSRPTGSSTGRGGSAWHSGDTAGLPARTR